MADENDAGGDGRRVPDEVIDPNPARRQPPSFFGNVLKIQLRLLPLYQ